jgi:beta-lactam-binding protein with PASTA domain
MSAFSRSALAAVAIAASACRVTGGFGASPPGSASAATATPLPRPAPDQTAPAQAGGSSESLVVPDLSGKTPDDARATAKTAGFVYEISISAAVDCEPRDRRAGVVVCQRPEPGERATRHTMISAKVDLPTGIISHALLESLIGLTPEQAKQRLKESGHVGKVSVDDLGHFEASCKKGTVCAVGPPGGAFVHSDISLRVNSARLGIAPPTSP